MKTKLNQRGVFAVLALFFCVMSCDGGSSTMSEPSVAHSPSEVEELSSPDDPTACDNLVRVQYEDPDLEAYGFHAISSWQGMQVIDNYVYIFGAGDTSFIQELDIDLVPTGWEGSFVEDGIDVINHPTGIAHRSGYPTFIGSGYIYSIDWDLFYKDKNLDKAVLNYILTNDRLVRPEYVQYDGQWYVASSGYDAEKTGNEMILMDADALSKAVTVDDPGVIIHRFAIPALVQDISWDEFAHSVILIQNIELHKGWRLTSIDIGKAIALGSGTGDAIVKTRCILPTQEPHILISELEGYARLSSKRESFIIAHPDENNNLFINDITDDQILP